MVDTIQLDWVRVEHMETKDPFNLWLVSGKRAIGTIEKLDNKNDFAVQSHGETIRVEPSQVVAMVPVEDLFAEQLTGAIDYGFSFTGGTNTTQSTLSAQVAYQGETCNAKVGGSSVFN